MRSWRRRLFELGRLVLPVALVLGLTTPHLQAQQAELQAVLGGAKEVSHA